MDDTDSKKYRPPFRSFQFKVSVAGGPEAASFAQISGLKMQVQTVEGRFGDDRRGVFDFVPVLTRFEPVTLSRGVVGDMDFLDWVLSSSANEHTGPTGAQLRRDITIRVDAGGVPPSAADDPKNPEVTWTLMNAMPIGYELSPMDASRSEILMESITFAYTGLSRKTAQGKEPSAAPKNYRPGISAPKPPFPRG